MCTPLGTNIVGSFFLVVPVLIQGAFFLGLLQNENARNENSGLHGILSAKRMSNP